jgi:hypothetical protein
MLTNNLKVQVDIPVWEWMNFAPAIPTNVSSMTTGNSLGNRYLYYQVSASLYRYDTWADSWNQLTTTTGFSTPTIMNNNVLTNAIGHFGRAIGSGGGDNTMQLAGLSGNVMNGYKIRIIGGTGVGQERTIVATSAPTTHERGIVTTAGQSSVIDATAGAGLKQWTNNKWRDYQFRCDYGTGRTQVRPILYNTYNTIVWSDAGHLTHNPWCSPIMNISVAVSSRYVIESHIITVDDDWDINPDSTSQFMIMSGGIWNVSQGTTGNPYFTLLYYDLLADQWYGKSTQSGQKTAVFLAASDLSLERITENEGVIFTERANGGGARYLTPTSTLVAGDYQNFEIRIVSGTGAGQTRGILSNRADRINVVRDWDTNPDNSSVYEIWRDVGKLYLVGGGDSTMFQYSQEHDQWSPSRQLDNGICQHLSAKRNGTTFQYAVTSITRTATSLKSITGIAAAGANYQVDDILTIDAKGGVARVTSVNATGGVTGVALEIVGTGYAAGTKTTTVNPAGGVGCTLTIAAGDIDFSEAAVTVLQHDFKVGDTVVVSGAISTGAAKFNGTYTITGVLATGLGFSYCSTGDPGAATATITDTISTTKLVDCTKNWAVDELKGKIIQICNNVLLATGGQARVILSNTANTISWTLATAASTPLNGTYRYIITKATALGTEMSSGSRFGQGNEGFATSGTTSTLTDTTKAWEVNIFAKTVGRRVRIIEGTGVGNEMAIISNTANTLTFATQAFTVDTTTKYIIADAFGVVSGAGGISTLSATPTVAGTGYAVGDIFALTGGAARGQVMVAAGGIPSVIRLIEGGTAGYTVVTGVATTNVVGTGTGLTVNVTAITAIGAVTVFFDNTKNWTAGTWVNKRIRFLTGTSQGNEYIITANTFNTITYATGTAPDVSTAYAILESSPRSFGVHIDSITGSSDTTLNNKYMYVFNGSGTVEMSRYNVTTEHFELMSYFPQFELTTTGTMYVYDGQDRIYIHLSTLLGGYISGRIVYYDLTKNIIVNAGTVPYGNSTLISGNRMEIIETEDGLKYLYVMRQSAQEMWRTLLWY